jgi:competence protein ComEC
MIVGQPGYLDQSVRDAFMASGTVHILSISGSHIGLVAFLSFFVIKSACRRLPDDWLLALSRRITPTRLAAMGTALPVVAYTLLAGAEIATVRSLVMILLFLLAVWLGRQEKLFLSLAVAALLILLHQPQAIFDISFQLSYSSVLAIAWVLHLQRLPQAEQGLPPERTVLGHRLDRWLAWLRTYAWMTGGVTLATLPLVAYHFNQIAWVGLVANLAVIPLAGLFLVPLGLISAGLVVLTGSQTLPAAWLNETGLNLLLRLVQAMARLPGAEWHVSSPGIPAIIAFYLLLASALASRDRPWISRTCLTGLTALLLLWAWSPRGLAGQETLRVTMLDVGQGDATVIELPGGETVLIDGGTRQETLDMGRAVIAPYLWDRGIFRLDHVIATHPQLDHVGGLISVLRLLPVAQYWDNGVARQEAFYRHLREAIDDAVPMVTRAEEGQVIVQSESCRLVVLNPSSGGGKGVSITASGTSLNNRSIVTRLDCGLHSFLFPGDVEREALARLAGRSTRTQVLKVPHHGAASSLYEPWLRMVQPDLALISVGRRNPYGHPAKAILQAYQDLGVPLYRTDRDGAVWITARPDAPQMTVRRAGDDRLHRVRLDGACQPQTALAPLEGRIARCCPAKPLFGLTDSGQSPITLPVMPMVRSRRSSRLTFRDHVRQNWKFAGGMLALSAMVAIGTGIATQGVENMMKRASLAVKAVNDPSKLSQEEKNQLKAMVKEKGLKDAYSNMSAEQKQAARNAVGGMSDEDKKRYKALLGQK